MDVGPNSSDSSEYHAVSNICSWKVKIQAIIETSSFFHVVPPPPFLFVCLFVVDHGYRDSGMQFALSKSIAYLLL